MATISITKEELLAMLEKAKDKAGAEDAKLMKAHKKDEEAALKTFRDKLKEAMKWDYKTAKEHEYRGRLSIKFPTCPVRNARHIEVAIFQIKADSRKGRFHLSEQSDWYKAAFWLPPSERPAHSVCE